MLQRIEQYSPPTTRIRQEVLHVRTPKNCCEECSPYHRPGSSFFFCRPAVEEREEGEEREKSKVKTERALRFIQPVEKLWWA